MRLTYLSILAGFIFTCQFAFAQDAGTIRSIQKLSSTEGNLGELKNYETFGSSITSIGDLNSDGIEDIAVGAFGSNSIFILFMKSDGKVDKRVEIADGKNGFTGEIDNTFFGRSIANIGDLDGDGTIDLAVGDPTDTDKGAIWILLLNKNGTVKSNIRITENIGGLKASLVDRGYFGASICAIGDVNEDKIQDICVGAPGINGGELYILYLNKNGSVKDYKKVNNTSYDLTSLKSIGNSIAFLGDFYKNNTRTLLIGDPYNKVDSLGQGAIYLVSLDENETITTAKKITQSEGGFNSKLDQGENFGNSVSNIGDLDGNGYVDIGVGAVGKKYGSGQLWGKFYILLLNSDATVKSMQTLSNTEGFLKDKLEAQDRLGYSSARVGDYDNNKVRDIAVSAMLDNDGGSARGAVYICMLNGKEQVSVRETSSHFTTLDIYPNLSVNGTIVLSLPQDNVRSPYTVQVYSLTGKLLQTQTILASSQNTTLDLKHFPAGTYIVKASNSSNYLQEKVVIVK